MKALKVFSFTLLAILTSFYLFITFYVAFKFHAYLPAADLITRADFLFDAYANGLNAEIFQPHNSFHWIVVPKLVLSLDMMWTQGSGWLIKAAALMCLFATLIIVGMAVWKTPNSTTYQRSLLLMIAGSLLAGPWIRESLNSPISQYTMISFFLVLTAYFVSFKEKTPVSQSGIAASSSLLLMSSGQAIALFPALIVGYFKQYLAKFTIVFLSIIVTYITIEFLLIAVFKQTPFLLKLYALEFEPEDMKRMLEYFWQNPLSIFAQVLNSASYFIAKFSFPQIYNSVAEMPLKLMALGLYLSLIVCFLRYKPRWQGESFWIICFLYCFLTAFLPAFLRMADGYGNRFSNLGSLLLLSAGMLVALQGKGRYLNGVIAALMIYLIASLPNTYRNIEKENHGLLGASMLKPQVAYSIGLRDPDLIVSAPGAWWREPDSQGIYKLYPDWKKHGLGVFSSESYKVFSGEAKLPALEKQCEYQLTHVFWRRWEVENEVAVYIQGLARANNEYLTDVVFYDEKTGIAVGRAVKDVAKKIEDLLFEPATWDGFIKLEKLEPTNLVAIAYGPDFRCQSFVFNTEP